MPGPEIKQAIEKIIDADGITQEDADFLKTLSWEKQQEEVANFLQDIWNKEFYTNAAPKIAVALEKYMATAHCDEEEVKRIKAFINTLRSWSESTEFIITNEENKNTGGNVDKWIESKNSGLLGDKINTIAAGSWENNINILLSKEKTSLGQVFEESSEAIRSNLFSLMATELLKDPYLSKEIKDGKISARVDGKARTTDGKRELTDTGEEIRNMLEKEISKNRSDNITFGLLEAIVAKVEWGWSTIKGNKEKIIEQKTSLLLTMQKLMKNGGLASLQSSNAWILKNADVSRAAIQSFQNNFKLFLKEKVKEAGLDLTNRSTKKNSVIEWSQYSTIWLLLSGEKRNQAVKDVAWKGFKEGFSYFNNFENTRKVMQSLLGVDGTKFDMTKIPKTSSIETKPSEEDMKALVSNMNELIKDMPTDPTWKQAQQLKEKVMNNKIDQIMNSFGPLKEFIGPILQRLNSKGGKGVLWFLVKSLWLKEGDVQKLIDRPYITLSVDEYKKNIIEGQKDINQRKKTRLQLWNNDQNWEVKTNYFKLANNLVYRENEAKNRVMSRVNDKGELTDLDLTKDEDRVLESNYRPARAGRIEDFIINDINTSEMATRLKITLESKFAKAEKNKDNGNITSLNNKIVNVEKKYFNASLDGKDIIPNDEAIKAVIKNILAENNYIYSTGDIIGAFLENCITEVNKAPENTAPASNISNANVVNVNNANITNNSADKKPKPPVDKKNKATNKKK
jgi:hypothetical protein